MNIVLLRVKDLKTRLKLSNSTIYAMIKRGDLPAPRKLGRSSVWWEAEVAAALDRLLGARSVQ